MTTAKYWGAYLNRLMIADDADPIMVGDSAADKLRKIVTYVEYLRADVAELREGLLEIEVELAEDEQ